MKVYVRQLLLILFFAVLSIVLPLYSIQKQFIKAHHRSAVSEQVLGTETQKENRISPARLIIPKLNIDANIEYVGLTSKGEMAVPDNTMDVGWFDLGPRPGEKGSAVIAGHFDGNFGEPAVFTNLYKLKTGDKLYIEDDKGQTLTFVVRGSRLFDPGYADDVFGLSDISHLNLVTCDGVWNSSTKSFSKRLVVFADLI